MVPPSCGNAKELRTRREQQMWLPGLAQVLFRLDLEAAFQEADLAGLTRVDSADESWLVGTLGNMATEPRLDMLNTSMTYTGKNPKYLHSCWTVPT